MCGGVGFSYSDVSKVELRQFYNEDEIERFEKSGEIHSFFWQERPVLPVKSDEGVKLYDWGNREKTVNLPRTGWARSESLNVDKWLHLHPVKVVIPASHGFEKKVWFETGGGIVGILVEVEGKKVVYMVTEEADDDYRSRVPHDRMPLLLKAS